MNLKSLLKKIIWKITPKKLIHIFQEPLKVRNKFMNVSFSQEGEDIIISRLVGNKKNGFFIDLGCHHPFRFSNTYRFYLEGWRGINVDASHTVIDHFKEQRPRDVNVCAVLGEAEKTVEYWTFSDEALNTICDEKAEEILNNSLYKVTKKEIRRCESVNEIVFKNLPKKCNVDFISIDLEGMDDFILSQLDLKMLNPAVIVVEHKNYNYSEHNENPLVQLLLSSGYELHSKLVNSLIFAKK